MLDFEPFILSQPNLVPRDVGVVKERKSLHKVLNKNWDVITYMHAAIIGLNAMIDISSPAFLIPWEEWILCSLLSLSPASLPQWQGLRVAGGKEGTAVDSVWL